MDLNLQTYHQQIVFGEQTPLVFTLSSNVGLGTTNTQSYKLRVVGNLGIAGRVDGTATDNRLPFLWASYSSLPLPGDYHGQFAHAHDTGKAYFAHAGAWIELVSRNLDNTVGTGTEHYKVGVITATSFTGDGSGLTNIAVSYAFLLVSQLYQED